MRRLERRNTAVKSRLTLRGEPLGSVTCDNESGSFAREKKNSESKIGPEHEIEASTERFLAIRAQSGDAAWTGGRPGL